MALLCARCAHTDRAHLELQRKVHGRAQIETLIGSLRYAREALALWRDGYNEVRPHSAIGNEVPIRLHLPAGKPGQPAVR